MLGRDLTGPPPPADPTTCSSTTQVDLYQEGIREIHQSARMILTSLITRYLAAKNDRVASHELVRGHSRGGVLAIKAKALEQSFLSAAGPTLTHDLALTLLSSPYDMMQNSLCEGASPSSAQDPVSSGLSRQQQLYRAVDVGLGSTAGQTVNLWNCCFSIACFPMRRDRAQEDQGPILDRSPAIFVTAVRQGCDHS